MKTIVIMAKSQYGSFDHPSTFTALALIILFVEMINVFSQRKKKKKNRVAEEYFAIFKHILFSK
jgi:hypothetical protein